MIPGVTGKRRGGGVVTFVGGVPGDGGHTSWGAPVTGASWVIGSAIPAAQVGDFALLASTSDRDGVFAPPTPSGWTDLTRYLSGNDKRFDIFQKFLVAGDLSGTTAITGWQGQHDYTVFLAIFRGCDPATPIYHWTFGESDPEKGTNVQRANSMLIEYYCDWGDSVPAQGAPSGAVRQYYSPNVRWEASMGLYTKANPSIGNAQKVGMANGSGHRLHWEATLQPAA